MSCCQTQSQAAENGHASRANGRSVYLETFGCQMNELDSELVRGHLSALGYRMTSDSSEADVVLYNTCSVREQAENKVLSRIGRMGIRKQRGEQVILGVIGCMAERDGGSMMKKYPHIDLMCGPGELDKLPMLLDNAMKADAVDRADRIALQGSKSRRSSTLQAADDNLEMLDLSRAFDPEHAMAGGRSAYVRITRGCNKFCTYCVVPFTRGPEVHRPPDAIVDECKRLADQGVIEITLLGQTVNHYIYTHGTAVTVDGRELAQVGPGASAFKQNGADAKSSASRSVLAPDDARTETLRHARTKPRRHDAARGVTTFADLLKRIHDEVPEIQRLRFVTSYPRDFGDDILQVMAESPRICRYLHVPAQSGSNRMLKAMNRGYTVEQYVEFVDRCRSYLPDVSIAGDIIVGFPGETEEDFQQSVDLLKRVRFKNNFIFKYSPRPGTVAIKRLTDDVPADVKRRRNNELLAIQADISASVHADWIGRTVDVFVEQVSQKSASSGFQGRPPNGSGKVELGWARPAVQMSGRTDGDLITFFTLPDDLQPQDLIGRMVPVTVTGAGPLRLEGRLATSQRTPNTKAPHRLRPASRATGSTAAPETVGVRDV